MKSKGWHAGIGNTRSRLIKNMICLCVLLAVINLLFIGVSSRSSYLQHSAESNYLLAQQMGNAYDLYIRQILELINKTTVFDFPSYDMRLQKEDPYDFYRGILTELGTLTAANTNIYSASLALLETGEVIDSRTVGAHVSPISTYYDRALFDNAQSSGIYISGPHPIFYLKGQWGLTLYRWYARLT